ncbi:hypothetical protein [Rhodohalobacter sp. 8-1]|uniref:hypothetical protein n=1 Tax=Rhodohalobacter sp. 8-1 TaxID=3131972 RepID=UPI0030ED2C21
MARRYRKEKELSYISLQIVAGVPLFTDRRMLVKISNGLKWCCDRRGLRIYEYVILPDRILLMGNTAWGTFDDIIEGFRVFSSKAIMLVLREGLAGLQGSWMIPVLNKYGKSDGPNGLIIWEEGLNKRVLYQSQEIDATALAIRRAPVTRGIVAKEEEYVHCSANPKNPLEGWQVAVTDRGI